jgi:hypothetical protein
MGETLDVQPFRIDIPRPTSTTSERLARTRFPSRSPARAGLRHGLEYAASSSGTGATPTTGMAEERGSEFDHFTTTVDGANVHFIHQRSPEPGALPVIITHGWPGRSSSSST